MPFVINYIFTYCENEVVFMFFMFFIFFVLLIYSHLFSELSFLQIWLNVNKETSIGN